MAHAYTPGLQITKHTRISRVRELPLPGRALVSVGDAVRADQNVLSAELPGDLEIVRIADRLSVEPAEATAGLKVSVGDKIAAKQLICQVKTFFGLFSSELYSPLPGVVEFFTAANGHLGIRRDSVPMAVRAYVDGVVVAVDPGHSVTIETDAALLQGIFGVGGERLGIIRVLDIPPNEIVTLATLQSMQSHLSEAILIGGASYLPEALEFAAQSNISAVVTGSIDAETLRKFVGYEIGVSITGDEPVPFSLVITEGFGNLPISDRALSLAKQCNGQRASINGATQVRAGAVRPEVIAPIPTPQRSFEAGSEIGAALDIGVPVRMIRVPFFGQLGAVVELPPEPTVIPTGALVRVARIRLNSGEIVTVPRANLELL